MLSFLVEGQKRVFYIKVSIQRLSDGSVSSSYCCVKSKRERDRFLLSLPQESASFRVSGRSVPKSSIPTEDLQRLHDTLLVQQTLEVLVKCR